MVVFTEIVRNGWKAAAGTLLAAFLISGTASAVDLPIVGGGKGGAPFRLECPPFYFMVGVEGRTGRIIDRMSIICATFERIEGGVTPNWKIIPGSAQVWGGHVGTSTGGGDQTARCSDHRFVSSMRWNTAFFQERHLTEHIEMACTHPKMIGHEVFFGRFQSPKAVPQRCPDRHWATGFHGRAGTFIDAIALICAPW